MRHRFNLCASFALFITSFLSPSAVTAEEDIHHEDQVAEEVVVWGRKESQHGRALSASEGLVGHADFSTRPIQRIGELVEVVPGMIATQHSGEGKANQYFLRGMNLDHGTDFSAYLYGMPVNLRAHAHGQGYLDLNFLIPEIISTVAFRKGPYHADRGDFSTAGTTDFSFYDRLEQPFIDITGGSYQYWRAVTAGSVDLENGHLLGALELTRNNGPWELEQRVKKTNFLGNYTAHWEDFETSVVLSIYDNEWRSTDQIPKRLVDAGVIDEFDSLDPDTGGESRRYSLMAQLQAANWTASAYVSRYELNLVANFTQFLDDRNNGDQHEQEDRRWIWGGQFNHDFAVTDSITLAHGIDLRIDDIGTTNLYRTTGGRRRETVGDNEVQWLSLGAYAQIEHQWADNLRTIVGGRVDHYRIDVDALLAENSDDASDTLVTPKFSAAWAVNETTELYVSYGKGFHSNDARGVVLTVDPDTGGTTQPIDQFVDQQGAELGLRMEGVAGLHGTLAWFWLESDSELLFVGDTGATEPNDGSKRTGIELSLFWQLQPDWVFDLNWSEVNSEFTDVPNNRNHIPNAHGRVVGAGLTFAQPQGWTASIRLRHFGDSALVEDDSVSHDNTTVVNVGASYEFGNWELGVEVLNVTDVDDYDIAYFYESQLQTELSPVEDIHFHPVDPRSLRVNVRYQF